GGTDPVTCLWTYRDGEERLVVDPRALDLPGEEDLPAEEKARRERAREQAGGVVGYATDRQFTIAAFSLSGRLFVTDLEKNGTDRTGTDEDDADRNGADGAAVGMAVRPLEATTPVFD